MVAPEVVLLPSVGEALRILSAGMGLESFPCPVEDERLGRSQEGAAATPSLSLRGWQS